MKHGAIYGLLILAVIATGRLPFRGHDVAKLRPVEVILAGYDGENVRITTDTEDEGVGATWQQAMTDLERRASGVIFQGTVSYILLEDRDLLPVVLENTVLNPNCRVCLVDGEPELKDVSAYLDTHNPDSSLRQLRAENPGGLPRLDCADGRYMLEHGNG